MTRLSWLVIVLISHSFTTTAPSQEKQPQPQPQPQKYSTKYQALRCPQPTMGTTWAILERDGASRKVDPYLSSLGQGETGTGTITSPPFVIDVDVIRFTICGHNSQPDGPRENYIALIDARKGKTLQKTVAPSNDAMQERSWDVAAFKGSEVRIEVCDGNQAGAFAWMGIGNIDAGSALHVDFRNGLPDGWSRPERTAEVRTEIIPGAVPFQRHVTVPSVIPAKGDVELPCGFSATRIFLLGCTVPTGTPLMRYGAIEVHYRSGTVDVFHLTYGFTLDGQNKLLSPSKAMHLGRSADPFQYVLAIAPAKETIDMIRLVSNPARGPIPLITAITCETQDSTEHLLPLPLERPTAEDAAWITTHTVSTTSPNRDTIEREVRKANKLPTAESGTLLRFKPHQLDAAFRSEGVALADFNGDKELDVAAGNVYYAGPNWKMQPMFGTAQEFPQKGYSDAFLCFEDDIDRNGAIDLVVVGFPGQKTHWLENPGSAAGEWKKHLAVENTGNESPDYVDVDGDGVRELVFINGNRCALARPGKDPTALWAISVLAGPADPAPGHGLGIGDVNGDGRNDVLIPNGWWEQPAQPTTGPWTFHAAELSGGAQLCVADLDGDGDQDVLGSSAHAYGIAWTEQSAEGWKVHMIDDVDSQTHAIHLADMNGDGLTDFVTGKRYWAHNGHDPGSYEPAVLCWYEMARENGEVTWIKHLIHNDSGVGLHFRVLDLNGDGLLDIVTSNKKGVYYFEQLAK
ncbi:MAG: FG-GAP repeat domain-containing protein [Pirellulaceae bacterium]